jgi:hypothetical protein
VVANVFGRGLGANGVPSLQEGTLRTLGTQLDEMRRNLVGWGRLAPGVQVEP